MAEMTTVPQFPPSAREVVVLVPAGSPIIGLIGFIEALDAANRFRAARGQPPLYSIQLTSVGSDVASSAGPVLQTRPAHTVSAVHTLILGGPSLDDSAAARPLSPALLAQAGRLAALAERRVSICSGAFVLGELGLLDGRRCTTHWLVLDQLRARFPLARVEDDAIFVEDGPVVTSAGATAGIDLALHLIRQDGGAGLALIVARSLVVFAQRPGGQSQFGSTLRLRPGLDERMRALVGRVVADPAAPHSVPEMARSVAMSPRHFARVFREQAGETPAAFVARVRVEAAQRALAHSDATVEAIADACGFGTAETMRRTFLRVAGTTPDHYRRHFHLR